MVEKRKIADAELRAQNPAMTGDAITLLGDLRDALSVYYLKHLDKGGKDDLSIKAQYLDEEEVLQSASF